MASEVEPENGPSYDLLAHPRAQAELDALGPDFDTAGLKTQLREASACRQPKTHTRVGELTGYPGFLTVRDGGLRAICELVSPVFRVLLVDKRSVVYDRVETAVARSREMDGGGRP